MELYANVRHKFCKLRVNIANRRLTRDWNKTSMARIQVKV